VPDDVKCDVCHLGLGSESRLFVGAAAAQLLLPLSGRTFVAEGPALYAAAMT